MQFLETPLAGAWVIQPSPILDERGRFLRAWCTKEFSQQRIDFIPVQANMGFSSRKGTLRGLHYQDKSAREAKLVRCTRGAMYGVVVDLRPESPTFCNWYAVELSAGNARMIYVPELCAHGYQTLEDETEMHYMTSQFYNPSAAHGVRFDDPAFGIPWPLAVTVISDQDRAWPLFQRQRK